ncbi:MAG: hypothetical protein ACOYPR_11060 [Saprospiraceae bacterium]
MRDPPVRCATRPYDALGVWAGHDPTVHPTDGPHQVEPGASGGRVTTRPYDTCMGIKKRITRI